MTKSVACPIACGICCMDCPHLGNSGCELSREERPPYCLSFTCEVCDDVMRGKITREEGLEILPKKWGHLS